MLGSSLASLGTDGPTIPLGFGSPESIGKLLLERFLVAFEAASLLLLIAAVGAVVLASRKQQPKGIDRESSLRLPTANGNSTSPKSATTPATPPGTPGREAEEVAG